MVKRLCLALGLLAVTLGGQPAAGMASGLFGGGLYGAAPAYVVPATADLYMEINRGGNQGAALAQLQATYRAHPGAAAALGRLMRSMRPGAASFATHFHRVLKDHRLMRSMRPGAASSLNTLLAMVGDRAAIALWAPTSQVAVPRVALVAQLKPGAFASGLGPLTGIVTLSPALSYHGVTVYNATGRGADTAYATVVSGDGVLATDLATVEQVIDAATFRAPSLAYNTDYVTTVASLPLERAFTLYAGADFLARASQAARSGLTTPPPRAQLYPGPAGPRLPRFPYAIAVAAAPDGLEIVTSVLPAGKMTLGLTPNAGAGVVGNNALVYESIDNLAGLVMSSGLLTLNGLQQAQAQSGISIVRDVLPLLSHEIVVDINDETSAIISAGLSRTGGNAGSMPALPGSIELATWVDSPAAAQQSMQRLVAAVAKMLQGGQSSGPALTLVPTTLPDGSTAYTVPFFPNIGYTIRGHWLMISTNLTGDITAARVPLASDPAFQAALSHVTSAGAVASITYYNVGRMLKFADAWLAFASSRQMAGGGQAASAMAGWRQVEPLLAPIRSIISATRQVGQSGYQLVSFITIQ